MDNMKLNKIAEYIQNADAIVLGAGAGLSASSGLLYSGKRFTDNFKEYIDRYGVQDMYSSGFYPFETQEEKWAYWSKHIYLNRYEFPVGKVYKDLLDIVSGKEYFIITTNVDHQFYKAGFPKERVFATQGDYGLLQCAHGCHKKLYDNEELVYEMVEKQKDCKIPSKLVPKCPVCEGEMEVNLRCDEYFIEDEEWDNSLANYERFIEENQNKNIVFLELGVGMNTPAIIKYQFWRMTNKLKDAKYICINLNESYAPGAIMNKSICIDIDISEAVNDLKKLIK